MTKRPDTHLSYQERKIGGLGMHLIRHYSSALKYRRNKDRNILTLYRVMRYNQITEG
jgi:anti-sigma regulatory factor (Ser/Thr protein kinase)